MNILFVGDVVGETGCEYFGSVISAVKKENKINFTIVNGENSGKGNGISKKSAAALFSYGADVITTGNHVFYKSEARELLEDNPFVLCPANIKDAAGSGVCIADLGRIRIAIINLLGRAFMADTTSSPFEAADKILNELPEDIKIILADFHAEATSEKKALAYYLSGRVTAVLGTHTHTQTADEQIINGTTAFITDAGMTGAYDSILGMTTDSVVARFTQENPPHFKQAQGKQFLNSVAVECDEKTGCALGIKRLRV